MGAKKQIINKVRFLVVAGLAVTFWFGNGSRANANAGVVATSKPQPAKVSKGVKKVKHAKRRHASEHSSCSKRELELRDCEIDVGKLQVGVGRERLRLYDGVWDFTAPLPLMGDKTNWQEIT